MAAYFSSLNPVALWNAAPGGVAQGLIWGIMALGVYITFRVLNFADMTVDGSFSLGGAVAVMLMLKGVSPHVVLFVSFGAGLLSGCITGILHTKLGIPDILAGILTQISLYSINLNLMGKANQAVPVNSVRVFFTSNVRYLGQTLTLTLVVDVIIVAIIYWFLGTELGSSIRATGINPNMSRAQGIDTNKMKIIALMLGNGLVALSGGILSEYQGFADVKMGQGSIVIGLAAVIIGEVLAEALVGKRLNFIMRLSFTIVGAITYYMVYVFVLWLKFPADDMKLLTAIVVAAFLAVPYLKEKRTNSFSGLTRRNAKLEAASAQVDKEDA
ncbi:ABC transporter permease [Oribacterium sp. WCC10]|uniref:ABC transporter permease n=1 Tax=Oribacterium sp. WCC10 TaxID=1855343 RepID=UPI0008ED31BF|nr:ABC transporter permease [Oribacterium sp. WCC10]SFG56418.1 putative ABC transport system permease protein [Oribacterium sp. WCC10]